LAKGIHLRWMPAEPALLFDWDDSNKAHLDRHAVSPEEAEQVILGGSLSLGMEERSGEDRHTELGRTSSGRLLVVVWTWRRGKVRVVTAFPAKRKWRAHWRRNRSGQDE
jgi:uncharacterized DUF497 family protein